MSKPQDPSPASLDGVLARAEHYAEFAMRNMGRVPPTPIRLSTTTLEAKTCGRAPASKKEPRS
jgi:hypothetical protein